MGTDRAPERLRRQLDLADVIGGLAARLPQAGAGVLAPGKTRDPGGTGDQILPFWRKSVGDRARFDPAMLLATMGMTVDGGQVIGWGLDGAPAGQALKQARLVVLDPHQQRVAGRGRGGEGFFGSAGRRR